MKGACVLNINHARLGPLPPTICHFLGMEYFHVIPCSGELQYMHIVTGYAETEEGIEPRLCPGGEAVLFTTAVIPVQKCTSRFRRAIQFVLPTPNPAPSIPICLLLPSPAAAEFPVFAGPL